MFGIELLDKTKYPKSTFVITKQAHPYEIYDWLRENMCDIDLNEAVPGRSRWWWEGRMNISYNIIGFKRPKDAALFKLMDF